MKGLDKNEVPLGYDTFTLDLINISSRRLILPELINKNHCHFLQDISYIRNN